MAEYFLIIISAALVNNFVLIKFLGLCPFFGTTQKGAAASGMTCATLFVLTLSAGLSYLVDRYLLTPLDLRHLKALVFIFLIASLVQLTEIILRKTNPLLHSILGIFLPLITSNCAVLGVALLNTQQADSFAQALLFGLGAGLGFSLVLLIFASLREQLSFAAVPKPFQGAGIAMITAGIMSLAFIGFTGLDV